jgi:hypothetical protein
MNLSKSINLSIYIKHPQFNFPSFISTPSHITYYIRVSEKISISTHLFPQLIPLAKRHILSFYKITSTQKSFFLPSFKYGRYIGHTHTPMNKASLFLFFSTWPSIGLTNFQALFLRVCFNSSYYQLINYIVQFTLSNQTQDNTTKHI